MSTHAPITAEVIPFPSRAAPRLVATPANRLAMQQIDNAQNLARAIVDDLEVSRHVAGEGREMSACGGTRTGRTLSWLCHLGFRLVALRNNPADQPLADAMREWLTRNGADHG